METEKLLKLDLGCGKNKKADHVGVDSRAFEGVDQVVDLKGPWPWPDDSVDEVNASHVVEHFGAMERVHFVNELHRVLKKGAKAFVAVPHWCSQRAYGDMTHQWPPVSEFWFYYLNKDWRAVNAPHNDFYTCDFDATWGYALRPDIGTRNQEFQMFAMQNYKEACMDIIATLAKK
jgi:SAM-dependent methyltransferase